MLNIFKPHVVKFKNGSYGIRRWSLGWEYLDSHDADYWWNADKHIVAYAQFSNATQAKLTLETIQKDARSLRESSQVTEIL